jgi:hypothetical protein
LAASDQLHEAGPGVVIFLVVAEVFDEQVDSLRQQGDLDLRRSRIGGMRLVLLDDPRLLFLANHAFLSPYVFSAVF